MSKTYKLEYEQKIDEVVFKLFGNMQMLHKVILLNPDILNLDEIPMGYEIKIPEIEPVISKKVNLWS